MDIRSVLVFLGMSVAASAGIINPSFEEATLSGSSQGWIDLDSVFGFNRCTIALCGDVQGSGPRTGEAWNWFGGDAAAAQVAMLEQGGILFPIGTKALQFYLQIPSSGEAANLTLSVDNVEVLSISESDASAYANYTLINVLIDAFADGDVHVMRFDYRDSGGANTASNFFIDDVALNSVPETDTIVSAALGLLAVAFWSRRQRIVR